MPDVFQNERMIAALLDSGATVNALSSTMADSLGLQQRTESLDEYNLQAANGGHLEVMEHQMLSLQSGTIPQRRSASS